MIDRDRDPDGDPVCKLSLDERLRKPSGGDLFYRLAVAAGFARRMNAQPKPAYEPTPAQIEAACAEIRRGWSAEVREQAKQGVRDE